MEPFVRQAFERFLAVFGLIALVGSYAGFVEGVFRDPFFVFWLAVLCSLLAAWHCISSFTERGLSVAEQLAGSTTPHLIATPLRRFLSCMLLLACLITFALMLWWESRSPFAIADIAGPTFSDHTGHIGKSALNGKYAWVEWHNEKWVYDPPQRPWPDYEHGETWTEELKKAEQSWFEAIKQSPAFPVEDVIPRTYVFAGNVNRESLPNMRLDHENARFSITKRYRVPWIEVKNVSVIVEDYEPAPILKADKDSKGEILFPNVFYAFVEPVVQEGETRSFEATFLHGGDESSPLLIIDQSYPEPFTVFVLSRIDGIYTYRVEVRLKSPIREETLVIPGRRCLIFDRAKNN